ncbi:hypothetical protein [Paraburkholderia sp. JHI869]|uniref:hypothetical protein n=1 Tax=Paraburkholderia sp. JHI869 TaxID=3112959 RepID=UPI00316DB0A6
MPKSSGLGRHDFRGGRNALYAIEPIARTEHVDVVIDGNGDFEVRDGAIEILRRIGAFAPSAGFSVLACHCTQRALIGALRPLECFLFNCNYHYFALPSNIVCHAREWLFAFCDLHRDPVVISVRVLLFFPASNIGE